MEDCIEKVKLRNPTSQGATLYTPDGVDAAEFNCWAEYTQTIIDAGVAAYNCFLGDVGK